MIYFPVPHTPILLGPPATFGFYTKVGTAYRGGYSEESGLFFNHPINKRWAFGGNVAYVDAYPYFNNQPATWTLGATLTYDPKFREVPVQVYIKNKTNFHHLFLWELGVKQTFYRAGPYRLFWNLAYVKDSRINRHSSDAWSNGLGVQVVF